MKKEAKSKTYHSHWAGSEIQSKYESSKKEFSSRKYFVFTHSSLLFGVVAVIWFIFAPYTLTKLGLDFNIGVFPWIGGTFLLFVLMVFNPLEGKLPSYETRIFWKICETLENLDLYWESWYSSKSKEVFLDRADKKFRKALSDMEEIIPPRMKNARIVEKRIRVPLKRLRDTLRQKFLPMHLTLRKGIRVIYNRLEELAVIFYEQDLEKLLEFDRSLEDIPESEITERDIQAMFISFWKGKIGKFLAAFALGNILSISMFWAYCHFSIEVFLQLFQEPTGIVGVCTTAGVFTVATWEALTRV